MRSRSAQGDYVIIPRATTHRWVPTGTSRCAPTRSRRTATSPRRSGTCRGSGSSWSTRRTASATCAARPSRCWSRAPTSRSTSSTAAPAPAGSPAPCTSSPSTPSTSSAGTAASTRTPSTSPTTSRSPAGCTSRRRCTRSSRATTSSSATSCRARSTTTRSPIPVPYYHSNVDSDEIMFYVGGDYEARKGSGIGQGSISLHPGGHSHGPQPGAVERSIGAEYFDELAVMVDTFRPLDLGEGGVACDDGGTPGRGRGRGTDRVTGAVRRALRRRRALPARRRADGRRRARPPGPARPAGRRWSAPSSCPAARLDELAGAPRPTATRSASRVIAAAGDLPAAVDRVDSRPAAARSRRSRCRSWPTPRPPGRPCAVLRRRAAGRRAGCRRAAPDRPPATRSSTCWPAPGYRAKLRTGGLRAELFPSADGAGRHPRRPAPRAGCRQVHRRAAPRRPAHRPGHRLRAPRLPQRAARRRRARRRARRRWTALRTDDGDGAGRRAARLAPDRAARARSAFPSFGTCSVAEPVDDLVALGLLPSRERITA